MGMQPRSTRGYVSFPEAAWPTKTKAASISAVHKYEKGAPSAEDGMNEEARYFWYLQNITRATALQDLNSIPRTNLKEMMAHINAFEVKYPDALLHGSGVQAH